MVSFRAEVSCSLQAERRSLSRTILISHVSMVKGITVKEAMANASVEVWRQMCEECEGYETCDHADRAPARDPWEADWPVAIPWDLEEDLK